MSAMASTMTPGTATAIQYQYRSRQTPNDYAAPATLFHFLVGARHLQAGEQLDVALRAAGTALEIHALADACRRKLFPLAHERCPRLLLVAQAARIGGRAARLALKCFGIDLAGFLQVEVGRVVSARGNGL